MLSVSAEYVVPDLIDAARWRPFDLAIHFKTPEMPVMTAAIKQFLSPDYALFGRWIDILTFAFNGESFSDIQRDLQRLRCAVALGTASDADLIEEFIVSVGGSRLESRHSECEGDAFVRTRAMRWKTRTLRQQRRWAHVAHGKGKRSGAKWSPPGKRVGSALGGFAQITVSR